MNVLRRAALILTGLIVSVPGVLAVISPARADGLRTGMTWSVIGEVNGYVHLGSDGVTNPYTGDTAIDQYHSILCLRVDGQAPPPGISFDFYRGWARGTVRATAPVRGDILVTQEAGNTICANTFGPGYRLAEFHDGRYGSDFGQIGGWSFWAAGGGLLPGVRYWVAVTDQPANAWNSLGAWPEPLQGGDQNDMILRAMLDNLVSPILRTSGGAAFQHLVRSIAGRQFDGDSNALMSTVIAEAEAGGIVNPSAPDWLAFKAGVASFGNVNGHAYLPQIFIPNYEDGLMLNNPIRMAVAGDRGQTELPAYTLSGGQVVPTTPVTESYAQIHEVWVLSVNDELGGGPTAAATPLAVGPHATPLSQSYAAGRWIAPSAVCTPNGLRNDRGQEYLSWIRVPDPAAVEPWWLGKLEIRVSAASSGGTEIKNVSLGRIKRADAVSGIDREVFMATWERAVLGDHWTYRWAEEDGGSHDDMGSGVVEFTESTYAVYSTGAIEWRVCSLGGGAGHDNFALQATATASSTYPGYSADRVHDGDSDTSLGGGFSWANNSGGASYPPQWVQLDFGTAMTFRRIVVVTSDGYPIRDFDIQIWNGVTWTTPPGGAVRGNTALQVTVNFTLGAQTSRLVRVYGLAGPAHQPGYVRVNEFEVYAS